jgi:hypothetical protein
MTFAIFVLVTNAQRRHLHAAIAKMCPMVQQHTMRAISATAMVQHVWIARARQTARQSMMFVMFATATVQLARIATVYQMVAPLMIFAMFAMATAHRATIAQAFHLEHTSTMHAMFAAVIQHHADHAQAVVRKFSIQSGRSIISLALVTMAFALVQLGSYKITYSISMASDPIWQKPLLS